VTPYAWTPERVAILREHYPTHGTGILDALNSLPGRPIKNREAVISKAHALGVRLDPEAHRQIVSRAMLVHYGAPPAPAVSMPVEEPPPPPKPCPELADAAAEARNDRVKDAIRRAMKGGRLPWESAVAIANRHGVTPRRVLVLVGMVR
jgi:hypothetical protein